MTTTQEQAHMATTGETPTKKGQDKKGQAKTHKEKKPQRETLAHMPKVDKVAMTLPSMSNDVQTLFGAAVNMSTSDIVSLVSHLQIAIRRRGVQQAAALIEQGKANPERQLKVGQRVKVVTSSNPRFIGLQGTVTKVRRIRCHVALDTRTYGEPRKDPKTGESFVGDYFFTSDVVPVALSAEALKETVQRLSVQATPINEDSLIDDEPEELVSATG